MDTLEKVNDLKGQNPKSTLLYFIIEILEKENQNFISEKEINVESYFQASTLKLSQIKTDLDDVKKNIKQVNKATESSLQEKRNDNVLFKLNIFIIIILLLGRSFLRRSEPGNPKRNRLSGNENRKGEFDVRFALQVFLRRSCQNPL